jgi:hypothetical protein
MSRPFLRTLHKNLNRLASFAIAVERASRTRALPASSLADLYGARVQKRVAVPENERPRVVQYLSDRGLADRYIGSKPNAAAVAIMAGEPVVEIQDYCLSDPSLPSQTGREKGESAIKTIAAAVDIGLLAERTLTVTSFGHLVSTLATDEGVFDGLDATGRANPFSPRQSLTAAVMLGVIRNDFPFQNALASRISVSPFSFRDHVLAVADEVFRDVQKLVPASPANREYTAWLQQQLKKVKDLSARRGSSAAAKVRSVATPTLIRPLEDVFLPRLEFWVDFGLLRKLDPGKYVYNTSPALEFFRTFCRRGPDGWASTFFDLLRTIDGSGGEVIEAPNEVLSHLRPSFQRLRGHTGYASIVDSTVDANLRSRASGQSRFLEVDAAIETLKALAVATPPAVRIISDRFRRPHDFTILDG